MVNEYERFSSGDDFHGGGGGDEVLDNYSFNNFDKNNSFWIIFLNVLALMFLVYLSMRGKTSHLEWVEVHPEAEVEEKESSLSDKESLNRALLISSDGNKNKRFESSSFSGMIKSSLSSLSKIRSTIMEVRASFLDRETVASLKADEIKGSLSFRYSTREVTLNNSYAFHDVLNTDGCTLLFKDLSYSVGKNNLVLLNEVSGEARPGEMLALMGASGNVGTDRIMEAFVTLSKWI